MKKHHLILALILFATFVLRFPSLFEPFWYGDEGIFAAVANNLNQGGVLYQDAWDNKPPMIYLTYAAIFKIFGVSMFGLRLVTVVVVMATVATIYEIGLKIFGKKRALAAAVAFGFLSSLRLVEGNLALTEIYMVLPICLAMMVGILGKFNYPAIFGAGLLLAVASLYKQVGALEAAALGIFVFLATKSLGDFVKKGLALALGFVLPFLIFLAYFAGKNLIDEFIFAAYTYYQIYLGESPRYALLINTLKFAPIVAAMVWGIIKKIKGQVDLFHLILLWAAFSFLGSYFSGRTYGHYLIQALPALSLLLASVNLKPILTRGRVIFAIFFFIPLVFLTKLLFTDFLSDGPLNQIGWWRNFGEFSLGRKSLAAYNDYFDGNVNSIMGLSDFFKTRSDEPRQTAYIWGDYPWLYAISDLQNPSRYVTSFHVFGVGNGQDEVIEDLRLQPPTYIIKPPSSIGYFSELEKIIRSDYTLLLTIDEGEVFERKRH